MKRVRIVRVICFEGEEADIQQQMMQSLKDGTCEHAGITIHTATLHQFPFPIGEEELGAENKRLLTMIKKLQWQLCHKDEKENKDER